MVSHRGRELWGRIFSQAQWEAKLHHLAEVNLIITNQMVSPSLKFQLSVF